MTLKMAKINMSKRKQAEQLVYDVMDAFDKTGTNTKRYKDIFAKMSNTEFESFMKRMWEDDAENFVLDICDYERDLKIQDVEKAAKTLGVPLEEYVMFSHLNMDNANPIVSKVPMITMYIIYKRLQQTTQKKNSTSTKISNRSATTGQVVGDDKNGRSSDVENTSLVAIGALNSAREFNGFRADGLNRKNKAYSDIVNKGSVSLEEVESEYGIGDRTVLNTIDMLYLGMGIKTDLIGPDLILNKTVKEM